MKQIAFVLVLASALTGCNREEVRAAVATRPAQAPRNDVIEVSGTYKGLRLITPEPVFVNMELAILCRGASEDEVESARLRYGPHAHAQISVYMNDAAAGAFAGGKGAYPAGAVIVKEKKALGYFPTGERERTVPHDGVGGMVKREPGYDREHGDWEYFYFEDPAKVERGKIASCVNCHQAAAGKGYVFGDWAMAARGAGRG
jgi:hypothetical protein